MRSESMRRLNWVVWAVVAVIVVAVPTIGQPTSPALAADTTFLREFWPLYGEGGIRNFGYVISPPVRTPTGMVVQYTERSRFELLASGEARLGELGRELTAGRVGEAPFRPIPSFADTPHACRYFPQTGHSLCFGFRYFWEHNGGEAVFGLPISEEFDEANPDTGAVYTVQYFTRARFEYHPEAPADWQVQLGRLGAQDAALKGVPLTEPFLPPVRPYTPEQRTARDTVNRYRSAVGVPPVKLDPSLNESAQSYSLYVLWDLQHGRTLPNHLEEDLNNPHFTGYHPWDRAVAAGYYGDRSVGETFLWGTVPFRNLPEDAVHQLMGAPYHRATLLSPSLTDMGYGSARGPTAWGTYQVATIDWGGRAAFKEPFVVRWPVDGARDVPARWFDDEYPNPLPSSYLYTWVGYPVSLGIIYPEASGRGIQVAEAGIYRDGKDPVRVHIAPVPFGDPGQWVHVIPVDPLEPGTTYVVRISGTDDHGVTFRQEWSFTTGR